jgi:hypothetical protein
LNNQILKWNSLADAPFPETSRRNGRQPTQQQETFKAGATQAAHPSSSREANFSQDFSIVVHRLAGIIQAAFALLKRRSIGDWPSYLFALTLSVVYNFTSNRKFTFKSAKNYRSR